MATAYFMQLLTDMTDAQKDQEHMELLIHSCPSIPDRTGFILGESQENPATAMIAIGKELKGLGADFLAIPCITAHFFHEKLEQEIGLPVVHLVKETVSYLEKRNVGRVGIMATDGTVQSQLFQKELALRGMEAILPDEDHQKLVMDIIYKQVKAGKVVNMEHFTAVEKQLKNFGAQVIILGCTELSMAKRDNVLGPGFLDAMEVLSRCCVEKCSHLKPIYQELITE